MLRYVTSSLFGTEFIKVRNKPWAACQVRNSYGRGTSQVDGRSAMIAGLYSVWGIALMITIQLISVQA